MFGSYPTYRRQGFLNNDYPVITVLIIINVVVFLLQFILVLFGEREFIFHLALSKQFWSGKFWQLMTYMFLHGDTWHLLFNMLALWMFGRELERLWGSREFLKYYLFCGIGAGLVFLIFSKGVVIGASGGVFGVLLAFGLTFPDQIVWFAFIFPMKAKFMVMIFGALTFLSIASPSNDGIAHFAHLGGLVAGFLYLKRAWIRKIFHRRPKRFPHLTLHSNPDQNTEDEELRREVDRILDKINAVGYDQLTDEEKAILFSASRRLKKNQGPDAHA